ncbi:hypothetical protein MYX07_04845 [Patescibacteria group bacterium AH-259-L07]|nr:hypothetical protein [Patescibacteria group bacterium AH-259-L07]
MRVDLAGFSCLPRSEPQVLLLGEPDYAGVVGVAAVIPTIALDKCISFWYNKQSDKIQAISSLIWYSHTKQNHRRCEMYIAGLGEVEGIGPRTKIATMFGVQRAKDLSDQMLSLLVHLFFSGDPVTFGLHDNKELRARVKRLNPALSKN